MRENKVPVFAMGPFFAQIPVELLKDKKVSPQAKVLYGLYHSFAPQKVLDQYPNTFVGQGKIASDCLGCKRPYVAKLTRELADTGWATVIPRGQGHTNIIILHKEKGKKPSQKTIEQLKKITREVLSAEYDGEPTPEEYEATKAKLTKANTITPDKPTEPREWKVEFHKPTEPTVANSDEEVRVKVIERSKAMMAKILSPEAYAAFEARMANGGKAVEAIAPEDEEDITPFDDGYGAYLAKKHAEKEAEKAVEVVKAYAQQAVNENLTDKEEEIYQSIIEDLETTGGEAEEVESHDADTAPVQ